MTSGITANLLAKAGDAGCLPADNGINDGPCEIGDGHSTLSSPPPSPRTPLRHHHSLPHPSPPPSFPSASSFLSYATVPTPMAGPPVPFLLRSVSPESASDFSPPWRGSQAMSPTGSSPSQGCPCPPPAPRRISSRRPSIRAPPLESGDKRSAANLSFGSLNMKGQNKTRATQPGSKWIRINQIMREGKIAILAVQESHLTVDDVVSLNSLFEKRIQIFASHPAEQASTHHGVAFVVNKELLPIEDIVCDEIVPGRALLIKIVWHRSVTMRLLNVYAPNSPSQNAEFWRTLSQHWDTHALPTVDILLGDFNVVEYPLDRLPTADVPAAAVTALQSFYSRFHLCDGWRNTFPSERLYTYTQPEANGGRLSRLDRVYMTASRAETTYDWCANPVSGFFSDHVLVTAKLTDHSLPFVGKGRWILPPAVLKDATFLDYARDRGIQALAEMESQGERTAHTNPQKIYAKFKFDVLKKARLLARSKIPMLDALIAKYKADIKLTLNSTASGLDTTDQLIAVAELRARLQKIESARFNARRRAVATNDFVHGETISKPWIQSSKSKKPRDILMLIRDPDSGHSIDAPGYDRQRPPRYLSRSDEMAEAAQLHHDRLQQDLADLPPVQARSLAEQEVLASISTTLSRTDRLLFDTRLTKLEVTAALKSSKAGKATGIDGIPYKFWKALQQRCATDRKAEKPHLDPVVLLTNVFNDIESHGLVPQSSFSEGWICPLYKKNDRREIANYRPITLLNTDYKLMTKSLALRLASVVHNVVHPSQAGFIPKRSIFDQTNLARLMPDYAEAAEINGAIIALDQEKAYDKIDHAYLWKVLEAFGFPDHFVRTVRNLYEDAESAVAINGVFSSKFKVTRGVRQGDPLSCLLFDLAIEPLACMLRNSSLHGFQIPGAPERLITTLFADDTTTYLSEHDSYDSLVGILNTWCAASTARFNTTKTEIIPIGTTEYRARVLNTRRLNPQDSPIEPRVRIAADGTPIRILGAWTGNKVNQATPWEKVLTDLDTRLAEWNRCHPTLLGRKLIVGMEVGGRVQYLAKAQGMPKTVRARLKRTIRNFVWDSTATPTINIDTLYKPIAEGGINLLDIDARADAITLTWLRPFLDLSHERPMWAFVMDEILALSAFKSGPKIDRSTKLNVFLQQWSVNSSSRSTLPPYIKDLLHLAKKYKVNFGAIKLSPALKSQMPFWLHLGIQKLPRLSINRKTDRCLRENHRVRSVGEMLAFVNHGLDHLDLGIRHFAKRKCCNTCAMVRANTSCAHPFACWSEAKRLYSTITDRWNPEAVTIPDGLSLTANRQKQNTTARASDGAVLFNPSITVKDDLSKCFRIFGEPTQAYRAVASRPRVARPPHATITAYTDGSCFENGTASAKAGAGIWVEDDHPLNAALRAFGPNQTNQSGELTAVLSILQRAPLVTPLVIVSDSRYCTDGLTKHIHDWEAKGWIGVANKELFQAAASWCRARAAPTSFQWVKGHSTCVGNVRADEAAGQGAALPRDQTLTLRPQQRFLLLGAQLSTTTQRLLYQGIRALKTVKTRKATVAHLSDAKAAILDLTGSAPSDANLWKATRHRDFSRKTRVFLWKLLHNGFRCGAWWENIPHCQERMHCVQCGRIDSMVHILTECTIPGQALIWKLVRAAITQKTGSCPDISFGVILGCGLSSIREEAEAPINRGASRLLRIMVAESAYLIWKVRCERVIDRENKREKWHTKPELTNRWQHLLNSRISLDQALTHARFAGSKKKLNNKTVVSTWSGLLANERHLPFEWVSRSGVLVGINLPERDSSSRSPEPHELCDDG